MKKSEILKKKGIKVSKVTKRDKDLARTDYQRNANFIVTTSNGRQFYSKNGSLRDALGCEKYATSGKNSAKTTPKTPKAKTGVKRCQPTKKSAKPIKKPIKTAKKR